MAPQGFPTGPVPPSGPILPPMPPPPGTVIPGMLVPPFLTPAELARLPHDNEGPRLLAIIWSLAFIAGMFLATRIYCKLSRGRGLWWDDHVLIASWLAIVAAAAATVVSVRLGYGKHAYDIPFENFLHLPLVANIGGTFSILAAVWSKTSFAITLLRLLRDTETWTKAIIWCIIISMNVAMGLSAVFIWIGCTPIEKGWNPLIPGSCYSLDVLVSYNMFSGAFSGTMDFILALLPWKLIWTLQMKTAEKLGVCFAMSMGIFAGVTAFVKLAYIPSMSSADIFDSIPLIIWGSAESAVTVMAASVPILRALLKQGKARAPPAYRSEESKFIDNFELQSRSTVTIQSMTRRSRSDRRGSAALSWMSSWKSSLGADTQPSRSRSNRNSMEMHLPADGKIVEIREISVEYDEKNDEEMTRQGRLTVPAATLPPSMTPMKGTASMMSDKDDDATKGI